MYVKGPRYEYKLFNLTRAKLWGWINLNNLTVLHSYHLKVIRDTPSRGLSIKLSSRSTNTKYSSLCGRHKKGKGRGRGGEGEGEKRAKSPSLFPFLQISYPIRWRLHRLQVHWNLDKTKGQGTDQICSL